MSNDISALAATAEMSTLDLDRPVVDTLLLGTVPGVVDYLAEDLRHLPAGSATVVKRYRDALLVAYDGPLRPLAAIRYFDTCAVVLSPDVPTRLRESLDRGVLGALSAEAPVRFRVGRIGEDRWDARASLESEYGWVNSPTAWDLNVEPAPDGLVAQVGGLFLTARFGRLHRAPASTNPVIGAVIVRLAKISTGQTVLDPFCGAGTLLVLAAEMARPGRLVGGDLSRHWARTARDNLGLRRHEGVVLHADAQRLPFGAGEADRIVANLPFGKRVGSHRVNIDMYPAAMREISRVLADDGRAVLLTEDKRLFREVVQRTPRLRVIKEVVLERGGAHPSVYVLTKRGRSRAPRRSAGFEVV